ncbi:MAG: tRNA-dihydrouridine synthase family protein [Nitrospiraceae bacterium]|nr:tRNA-dihydrouridine synthase family protein [Nitrospiraceae bacterium]
MPVFRQQITVRGLVIDPPLLLAPMAGLTHSALRQIIAGFGGIGLLSTEMLSAKRLPAENPTVSPWLVRSPSERPLSYQLLLSRADEIAPAIDALHACGADAVDFNMGCPAAAVGKFGAGIRLMEEPAEVRRIVADARKRTTLPLSAKIRIGASLDDRKLRDFCVMLQEEGIDLLSVHARLKHESFARTPRWEYISRIKEWISIPVVVNGGIFSVADAKQCLEVSGADGLMIGRGAVIKPWLFAEISRNLFGREIAVPSVVLPLLYASFLGHLASLFRPQYRLGRLKEFTHYFARNYRFGHHLASRVQSSGSVEEARERAEAFFLSAT